MPVSRTIASAFAKPSVRRTLALVPRLRKVLAGRHALKVVEPIVEYVAVAVVNVTAAWDFSESTAPNVPMKLFAAARQVDIRRPSPIQAAVEILRVLVKVDRITVFRRRLSADFHPLAVKNK